MLKSYFYYLFLLCCLSFCIFGLLGGIKAFQESETIVDFMSWLSDKRTHRLIGQSICYASAIALGINGLLSL